LARTKNAPDCPGRGWAPGPAPLPWRRAVAGAVTSPMEVAPGGGGRGGGRPGSLMGWFANSGCRGAVRGPPRGMSSGPGAAGAGAPWTMPATSAVARSAGLASRAPPRSPGPAWWRLGLPGGRDPFSPPPTPGTGGVAGDGGGWADQAAQQKLNAQLTRAWCRRMAMSERTWKSALAERRRITAIICHGE
jgi:hypothetical protein